MRTLFVALLSLLVASGQAQEWEKRKEADGIVVYSKKNEGSEFDSFKAVMVVKGKPEQIVYILTHMDVFADIFPNTKEIRMLVREEDHFIVYTHNNVPWPADNRDGIYETHIRWNQNGGFSSKAKSVPDYLPEKEGVVRVYKSQTVWNVEPVEDGKIRIEYIVEAEPGGSIPSWLLNTASVEVPYDTFVNLKDVLREMNGS